MDAPDDLAMPFLLTATFNQLVDAVHERLADEGFPDIRAVHGFAMQAIGTGCTGSELGARLEVSKQAATQTARSLTALGLVERRPSETDRRAILLVPTERGRAMLRHSARAFRSEVGMWRSHVGDESIDAMLATLRAIGHAAEPTE